MGEQLTERKEQGRLIAQANGLIKRTSDMSYTVTSQSGRGCYDVNGTPFGYICSCPDFMYRGSKCKHIHAVEISIQADP